MNLFQWHPGRPVARLSSFMMVTGLALALFAAPLAAGANGTQNNSTQTQANANVTIPAGGTVTLSVRGFCLDFGKPFPTGDTSPNSLADDKVRAALNYSIGKGYTDGNPSQVELAVWFLRDGTWHNTEHTLAQEIVNNATAANAPSTPAASGALNLNDAVAQNKVAVTAKFVAQTQGHYYGDSQVQIKNSGTSDLQIYMPVGTVFTAGTSGTFQDLASYQLSNSPAQASTPAATGTVESASVTVAPSETVTSAATTAPVETATTASTATAAATSAPATSVATMAATVTTSIETPTTAPTMMETATTAPTEMPTQAATPTSATSSGSSLPATGAGDNAVLTAQFALLALATVLVASGLALKAAKR